MSKAIILNSVSKYFNIGGRNGEGVLSHVVGLFSGKEKKKKVAVLSDITLEVNRGGVLGLIGRNGSGKSTLLRLIAGIYGPDKGSVQADGHVMYINGLNHGTKPRLTMRENIFLAGAIMGFSKKDVRGVFDDIVSFSGLDEFLDTKIYQFSSGMIIRLNFSIFINFTEKRKPDILLIDEILGTGGDIDFNNKIMLKIADLMKSGKTIVMASHNLQYVASCCNRAVWIEGGKIIENGNASEVVQRYKASSPDRRR
jgi:ABC-type polysaccharide/polyol phosphate transport system ATPase subunit